MPQEKKGKNPRAGKDAKTKNAPAAKIEESPQCHIHNKVRGWEVNKIRENVCVTVEPLTKHTDGKYYCLFHLPVKEKDIAKFEKIFKMRLNEAEKEAAKIEALCEDELDKSKEGFYYDFRYVWFPSEVRLINYNFLAEADFKSATFTANAYFIFAIFSAGADFSLTTFTAGVDFHSATFTAVAGFSLATFKDEADFSLATFTGDAHFNDATFTGNAYFDTATFTGDARFSSAVFTANAYFLKTKFGKNRLTSFYKTKFTKYTFFDRARFRNKVRFNSIIFGSESNIFFRRTFFAKKVDFQYCAAEGYVRFSNLRQGKENKFDFQEAAFEKASRVSFHTVRLFPNWFVNVDARKFVFTDIKWKNLDSERRNKNIDAELENLKERKIKEQNKRLLEIACRQLGVNAEENNRYEEAAKFRYMAMETKRLEELKHFSFSRYLIWLYKWTSGYGESWSWAAMVLLGVLLFFGALYVSPLSTFDYGEKKNDAVLVDLIVEESDWTRKYDERFHRMNLGEGLVHSLYVAALQRPEPKAADTLTKLFIILETIFAPVQAALLALAIRRKFMR